MVDFLLVISKQAHYPASCSHMSQWMDDGGYYEGMTMEAQSKHLAKLISKRCPSCQAQIEKNEGCLQYVPLTTSEPVLPFYDGGDDGFPSP